MRIAAGLLVVLRAVPVLGAAFVLSLLVPAAAAADRGRVRGEMLVNTRWLAARLDRSDIVVLHVGVGREGYDAGHIPSARFVAFEEVATSRRGIPNEMPPLADLVALVRRLGLDDTKRIVLYDEEAGLRAARGYVVLDYLGLGDRAALLDGHLTRWRAEGRPLSTELPAITPTVHVPRVRPEVIVSLETMRDLAWAAGVEGAGHGRVALIDARPESQYTGTEPGEAIARPGHIPGAASLFWMKSLVSKEDPVLRPPDELRALFATAGAGPDSLVVTYCRTGVQASHSYFVARYLGYDPRLYDGSFYEWSAQPDTPVASAAAPPAKF